MAYYKREGPAYDIPNILKLLRVHKAAYGAGVNGGVLVDHLRSLKRGIQFFSNIEEYSLFQQLRYDMIERIEHTVTHVKQKLQSLRYQGKYENLEHAYADLREHMENVMMKPESNEYDVVFPDFSNRWYLFESTNDFLRQKILKLVSSSWKAGQESPMEKELKEIFDMLSSSMKPLFIYASAFEKRGLTPNEEDKKIFATIANVLERATCFIYLSFVGKMDDDMVLSLRNSLSGLIIEKPQIMKMYLVLDTYSSENLISHVSMSMRLLEWNIKGYLGTELGATLEEHFMSIKQGLKFIGQIISVSGNKDVEGRIQNLLAIVKQKLYSLKHHQEDGIILEHAYGKLREEMQSVVMQPGTHDHDFLFPEIFSRAKAKDFSIIKYFLLRKIKKLVTSMCKTKQIDPVMKELEELREKLTSLDPLFDYAFADNMKENEETIFAALTTFLDRATCLVYLSFIGNLNEDMLVSLRTNFSLLIEEAEIKEMFNVLGIIFEGDLDSDIDISLSLLKRQEEHIHEALSKNDTMSLKHGLEFLKRFYTIYTDEDFKRRIILLVGNVKRELESLTYKEEDEHGAYADMREEMKNLILNPATDKYDNLFPDFLPLFPHLTVANDFLIEKITALLTSDCKADEIAPMKKELQDLQNMVTSFKPLGRYLEYGLIHMKDGEKAPFLTLYHKVTLLVYLCFVGKMDIEMMLLVKSNIATAIKETCVLEMYTVILSKKILNGKKYGDLEVYLIENLTWLLKSNVDSLNDANSKLYEALVDTHSFLLTLPPNVFLKKLHLLKPSLEDILRHSIPIVYSCYLEHAEVDISAEWNCVLDLIKHHKSEAQEMKLYYFPRTDDLGFLEFFSGYLEDLMGNQEISIKEEVHALHFEFQPLLSLAKETNQELDQTPWSDVINMAYQAEYLIDIYLASSSRDLGLLSSLSKIIEELKNIRADLHGLCCESLTAQDVAVPSELQVGDNDALSDTEEKFKDILEQSYNHLPNHLRSCLLYLGSYPKDHEISVDQLINLWICEGFVRGTNSQKAEEVGKEYLDDLIVKGFVKPSKERYDGRVKAFQVHNRLRNFCLKKAKEEHFFTILFNRNQSRPLQDPRRLIIINPMMGPMDLNFSHHSLRTMISFDRLEASVIENGIESHDMVLLRVLLAPEYEEKPFPAISTLVHLRYLELGLGLGYQSISVLPASICKLRNLQIFILKSTHIMKVPDFIWDMVKLRQVNITGGASFKVDGRRLENSSFLLENLTSLSKARVKCADSKWLSKLSRLEKLSCAFVEDQPTDTNSPMLSFNDHLASLKVEKDSFQRQRFISKCQLPKTLRELTLSRFFLESNDISEIGRAVPHLEVFKIYNCYVPDGYEWNVDDEDFPKLKVLKLRSLEFSKWIVSENSFPSLEQLWVEECTDLDAIPLGFGSFPKLRLISVKECAPSVDDSARAIEEENTKMRVGIDPLKKPTSERESTSETESASETE